MDLWYPTDVPLWAEICQVVQQDLNKVGIRAAPKEVAYAVFNEATARRHAVAFSLYGWTEDYPDASDFLGTQCDGTRIVDEECTNTAFYNNDEVNGLLHAAAVATDERCAGPVPPGGRPDPGRRAAVRAGASAGIPHVPAAGEGLHAAPDVVHPLREPVAGAAMIAAPSRDCCGPP